MAKKIILFILTLEAKLVLRRFRPKIIAITGSVGKTSTKEAIGILLAQHFHVAKSPKSYNSEFGVPLAILGLESAWNSPVGWALNILRGAWRVISRSPYPAILVLEMGVDRPRDFDPILAYMRPNIAVVTAIGMVPVHVEFFQSPEAIADEKSKLVGALGEHGVAILNADDPLAFGMRKKTSAQVLSYGFGPEAAVRAVAYKMLIKKGKPDGVAFKIDHDGKTMPIQVPGIIGEQNVYALLAAAAVGITEGLNLIEISEGLMLFRPPAGRLRIIEGIRDTLIIDDSYNASPLATAAALHVLGDIPFGRKIAVLGDMLELGKYTTEEHKKIGTLAKEKADVVIAVGIRAKFMEEAGIAHFYWFPNASIAADFLKKQITEGDVVLIKGSQGVRMEKITEALMAHPEDAPKLLARQENYWKKN